MNNTSDAGRDANYGKMRRRTTELAPNNKALARTEVQIFQSISHVEMDYWDGMVDVKVVVRFFPVDVFGSS